MGAITIFLSLIGFIVILALVYEYMGGMKKDKEVLKEHRKKYDSPRRD